MPDAIRIPEEAQLLALAIDQVHAELVESIRPALLLNEIDATPAARAEAAVAAVHRVIGSVGNLWAVAAVAGAVLSYELRRSLDQEQPPLPPRLDLLAATASAREALDRLLVADFRAMLGDGQLGLEPEDLLAMLLADSTMLTLRSERGRAIVAWLCGLRHGAMLAEARAAERIGGGR
jgi:hypothetical protein